MAMGDWHVETGILQPGRWGYSLAMDGGGVWQLYMTLWRRKRYLGRRVTVEGYRSGFDLIDVHHIRSSDEPRP